MERAKLEIVSITDQGEADAGDGWRNLEVTLAVTRGPAIDEVGVQRIIAREVRDGRWEMAPAFVA